MQILGTRNYSVIFMQTTNKVHRYTLCYHNYGNVTNCGTVSHLVGKSEREPQNKNSQGLLGFLP